MKFLTACTLLLTAASGAAAASSIMGPKITTRDPSVEAERIARLHQTVRSRGLDYREIFAEVMDLMTKPGLTKRDDLYKRAVVADVLNGINDVIKTHKLDMSGALRGGVDALRNASMTVNYNEVVPLGFTVAIDQNTQIQQIPFGNMVGGMVKSLVGSFDWNGFVNRDVFNFASGAVSTLDANAVVAGAINTFVTAIQ